MMLNFFRKSPKSRPRRVIGLCEDGYRAVIGESYYQDALRATASICSSGLEGRRTFRAALVAEPQNPYDANAVAIHSPRGKLGHLSREDAVAYRPVLEEIARLGYDGGECEAYITGGACDKPSLGVVLRLADPSKCLSELLVGDQEGNQAVDDAGEEERTGSGSVRGRHYTKYVEEVRELRRSGQEVEAERLLLDLADAAEAEAEAQGLEVPPWYYEQLAISYRKRKDIASEIAILERYARQRQEPGPRTPKLLDRLAKAQELAQRDSPGRPPTPEELAAKASEKAAKQREAKAAERQGRPRHHEAIWPTLSRLAWRIPPWQGEGVEYRLAAGPRVPSLYSGSMVPALYLSLRIQKRQAVLGLYERTRTGRTEQFLRDHSELIAKITGSPPDDKKQVMWRIAGKGWAGSPEGWPKLIQTIESLTTALAPHLEQLGESTAKARIDQPSRHLSR